MLLFVFAFAVGGATLIENSYDTVTAKVLVYNARWFEVVLLLLVINFIGNIGKYRLFQKKKISSLMFHLAFIVVILGAGVTRYTGFEGIMPIKEGEISNTMFSADAYLQIDILDQAQEKRFTYDKLLYLTTITDNSFLVPVEFPEKDKIEISYKRFIKNAIVVTEEDSVNGTALLEIMLGGRNNVKIYNGEVKEVEGLVFAFNNDTRTDAIQFIGEEGNLKVISPYEFLSRNMSELSVEDRDKNTSDLGFDTLRRDTINQIGLKYLLFTQEQQIMVNRIYKEKKIIKQAEEEKQGKDVLFINLNYQGENVEIPLFGGQGYTPDFVMHQQGDLLFKFGYGSREIEIPFSIRLDDFVLEKYPGGVSPSSFLSHVTLMDDRVDLEESHTIFMNNVMDYGGYRFFQSSYEPDESGTVLSVNHDFWGTWITYIGYIFLALGFVLSFINPDSRFSELLKKVIKLNKKYNANEQKFIQLVKAGDNSISANEYKNAIGKYKGALKIKADKKIIAKIVNAEKKIEDIIKKGNLIRSNKKRAKDAKLLIWVVLILEVISIYASHIFKTNVATELIILIVLCIVYLVSAITFIKWFRRAYYNLNIRTRCNYSEGWAAGSWFVPIISLYRPYQIMNEMWIETSRLTKSKSNNSVADSTFIIRLWWLLFIMSKASWKIPSTITGDVLMSIVIIISALLTVRMIKLYTLKEEKLEELEK